MNMQIIIPMTGYGSRFVAAGYKDLKPFINVQGRPILQWIIDGMYPGEKNILFVCRKEHLDTVEGMEERLLKIAPTAEIFAIDDWVKKGPVFDVLRAADRIRDDIPCIINYCDFYMTWDYRTFAEEAVRRNCDGAIPCYSGFHPHLLIEKNLYASCLVDKEENLVEIREKYSFEADKTKARHSPGVYYFKNGTILKKYCRQMIEADDTLNGEFYASLPYNYMVKDNCKVWVPVNVKHFCQWGTPEDLEEYLFWTESTRYWDVKKGKLNVLESVEKEGLETADNQGKAVQIIIPMAGAGQRFADEGYTTSKPAIPTTDRRTGQKLPMVVCATKDLPGIEPDGSNVTYVDRAFHRDGGVEDVIRQHYPKASFITIDKLTEGQACTCLLAKEKIDNDTPLLIAGCDNGMAFDAGKFQKMTQECDVLAFTYRHNPAVLSNPDAYGWMEVEDESTGKITGMSIKKAVSDHPMDDHAIVATFWFRRGSDFVRAAEKMIREDDRVNGEFYVDEVMKHCLELGLDTRVFEVERYIGWGTPADYEGYQATVDYWREFTRSKGFLAGK